ncbi:DUF932 domain-containing protein [Actinoplanes sp. ATCC 53533]|uniref:DUF932 domain-containing protein n=1 Tax=Actinoplanes sp. ATCC 53533 TaxID=1288362 RepID=UPI000F7B1F6C|nr:DUF932 domain-containing protein [Actinoplanes sp. ATCC 53533]RSM47764.1 DUF932 domain-containing protein [Actinoplanes sp. ATCC 53533]
MAQPTLSVAPNRHIGLDNLTALLNDQKTRSLDAIVGAGALHCDSGNLIIPRTTPVLTANGVTMTDGSFTLGDTALTGVSAKLNIPAGYLRRMAHENMPLLDTNVNSWLSRDDRRFLVRCLRHRAAGGNGTARAFLSDRYLRIDNLDVLMAALDGIQQAGVAVEVASCDLTERRMYVRFVSPEVKVIAPQLLKNYRSPFDGRRGSDLPVISGGFLLRNSETGYGRYTIAPWLRIEVCKNGQTVERGTLGRTHIGARITDEDGIVDPSPETMRRLLDLITSQTIDAVRAFLDVGFVTRAVRDLERAAGVALAKPDTTIKIVAQRLRYTQDQQEAILAHFIAGADLSAGGIMQAVTSVARSIDDADQAYRMESTATLALRLAAAAADRR